MRRAGLLGAAAAIVALLAFWLLRPAGDRPADPAGVSPSDTPAATGPAPAVSPGETPAAAPLAEGRGAAAGALAIPGPAPPRATLTVLREGREIARAESPAGLFRLEYPRDGRDAAPFVLLAEAPGRVPATVALPRADFDAGEIRLLAGLAYGGRLRDAAGAPVSGVIVDFSSGGAVAASSPPSAADGSFLVSLPAGTSLQGMFGDSPGGWSGPPTLQPKARGRLFLPAEARPEGLALSHEVALEERPVALRLRFLDEASGRPAAGARASLWSGQDFAFVLPSSTPFDAGTADEAGVYAPLWPLAPKNALLRVEWNGRVLWTYLDRTDVEGKEPRDLLLPPEPLVLAVRCVEDGTGKPVAGARVVLGTNAMPFAGTTDAAGSIRWALFPSESFDPEPLEVVGWSAAWRDAAGNPRRDVDMAFRGPAAVEEGPSPVYGAPLEIRLGRGASPGTWVRVDEPAGSEPFRPEVLRACDRPEKGYYFLVGQPAGPEADAAGRPCWWFWDWSMDQGGDALMPKEGEFSAELTGQGRAPLVLRTTRAAVKAAARVEAALVFPSPAAESMTRTLRVVGPDGKPVAGAIVAVVLGSFRPASPWSLWDLREVERAATGADGRVDLHRLDPAGACRVAAWDPATGNSGLVHGLDLAAPEDRWRIALEPPREFRVRVSFAGGGAVTRVAASLSPLSTAFASALQAESKDGDLRVASCPVAICIAWVGAFGPKGEYRFVAAPAAEIEGKDVALEKR
jgi:hypothetical protein